MVRAERVRLRNARSHGSCATAASPWRQLGSRCEFLLPGGEPAAHVKVSEFDYELPSELIAQRPAAPRDSARLLVHRIGADHTQHLTVRDLPSILEPGDLLIVNDTRVRAARLAGRRASGGAVEITLLERIDARRWSALARPAGRLRPGERIELEDGAFSAELLERARSQDGALEPEWLLALEARAGAEIEAALERAGRMPLPPYIRRAVQDELARTTDRGDYQTVFARALGAVAAPTAGLHFTPDLLERLASRGIERAAITLHVGAGTFKPVSSDDTEQHVMHEERFDLTAPTVEAWKRGRARGSRVVAVGTTSVRVIESCASVQGLLEPRSASTRLFLVPGVHFRAVDALLTNFHLPRSTLLMLVAAFAGRERVLRLYREAIELGYRFYSYGDAMLLLP
jgi:S-adenosylmethionine:tRNA ribosyltransferase-isomerase